MAIQVSRLLSIGAGALFIAFVGWVQLSIAFDWGGDWDARVERIDRWFERKRLGDPPGDGSDDG